MSDFKDSKLEFESVPVVGTAAELFIDSAVQAIKDSVSVSLVEIGDRTYLDKPVHLPPEERMPKPLELYTLKGFVDYIKNVAASDSPDGGMIHVSSPTTVEFLGMLEGRSRQRPVFARATHVSSLGEFSFGRFYPLDRMVVYLQSLFAASGDRDNLLAVLGNIQSGTVATSTDDGISQTVQTRQGVRRIDSQEVKNPVTLFPKRSFSCVETPGSPFVLRFQEEKSGLPSVALFEADGGEWRLKTVERIVDYLIEHLPENKYPIIR